MADIVAKVRNSVISLRLGADLELQLEDWRSLRPKPTSRSRAIRILLKRALAAEQEHEELYLCELGVDFGQGIAGCARNP